VAGEVIRIPQTAPPKSITILGLECLFLLPVATLLAYSIFGIWGAAISLVLHALLIYVARNSRYRIVNPITINLDDDSVWAMCGYSTLWSIHKKDIVHIESVKFTHCVRLQNEMIILHSKNKDSFSITSSDYFEPSLYQTLTAFISKPENSNAAFTSPHDSPKPKTTAVKLVQLDPY
jgi:hypothetical protein